MLIAWKHLEPSSDSFLFFSYFPQKLILRINSGGERVKKRRGEVGIISINIKTTVNFLITSKKERIRFNNTEHTTRFKYNIGFLLKGNITSFMWKWEFCMKILKKSGAYICSAEIITIAIITLFWLSEIDQVSKNGIKFFFFWKARELPIHY